MRKVRKNDEVMVIAGQYKGKRGRVLKVVDQGTRVIVEGIQMVKRHVRPNPQKNQTGGIVEKEASIDISNVAVYDTSAKKATRIGFKYHKDGHKVRYSKASGEEVTAV